MFFRSVAVLLVFVPLVAYGSTEEDERKLFGGHTVDEVNAMPLGARFNIMDEHIVEAGKRCAAKGLTYIKLHEDADEDGCYNAMKDFKALDKIFGGKLSDWAE